MSQGAIQSNIEEGFYEHNISFLWNMGRSII